MPGNCYNRDEVKQKGPRQRQNANAEARSPKPTPTKNEVGAEREDSVRYYKEKAAAPEMKMWPTDLALDGQGG